MLKIDAILWDGKSRLQLTANSYQEGDDLTGSNRTCTHQRGELRIEGGWSPVVKMIDSINTTTAWRASILKLTGQHFKMPSKNKIDLIVQLYSVHLLIIQPI